MRVIISGPVTEEHLADADLLAGITPTILVTNDLSALPPSSLPTQCFLLDPMLPGLAEQRINYVMVQNAEALVLVGENDRLLKIAQSYGLLTYCTES